MTVTQYLPGKTGVRSQALQYIFYNLHTDTIITEFLQFSEMSLIHPTLLAGVGLRYPGDQTVWNRNYFIKLDSLDHGNTFTVNLQSQSVLLGLQESSEDSNLHVQRYLGVHQSLVLLLLSP